MYGLNILLLKSFGRHLSKVTYRVYDIILSNVKIRKVQSQYYYSWLHYWGAREEKEQAGAVEHLTEGKSACRGGTERARGERDEGLKVGWSRLVKRAVGKEKGLKFTGRDRTSAWTRS